MDNKLNFDHQRANNLTEQLDNLCAKWAWNGWNTPARGYASAEEVLQNTPDKKDGEPPHNGYSYPIYFSGHGVGDTAVFRNGDVWSGATVWNRDNSMKFLDYKKAQIDHGFIFMGWSEFYGPDRVVPEIVEPVPEPTPEPVPALEPTPVDNAPQIGDKVITSATHDAQNGLPLALEIINDGESVWQETNGLGNAVLVKDGIIMCAVNPTTLTKA